MSAKTLAAEQISESVNDMKIPELTEPVPQSPVSPGQLLAERRQDWGLSIPEVAANLNLGLDTIEALESDDYSNLPGSTFVKGYMRSYAKLLKLDAEDLISSIDLQPERITEIPSSRAVLKSKGKTRSRDKKSGGGFFRWILLIVVIGIVIAVGLTQLPKLGINQISDLFPVSGQTENETEAGADASNPAQTLLQAEPQENSSPSNEQAQGALIRIE